MNILERILVPLDGSEMSTRILEPVGWFAERAGSTVRAIHVIDGREVDQALLRGEDPRAAASAELARVLEPLRARGIAIAYDSYAGDPAARILDDAITHEASVIAMVTHGRSGTGRWLGGSVAEHVLRRSPVPVLLANPRALAATRREVRRILLPLDGSRLAARAIAPAIDFARLHDAEIVAVHVLDGGVDAQAALQQTGDALDLLAPHAQGAPGARVRTLLKRGPAAAGILEAADEERPDLIVMSTHGRTGAARWAFGSTAEEVARHAQQPLLVVRAIEGA